MAQRFDKPGTLLRGPDGKLYFIPDDALAAHQLEQETANSVNRAEVFDRHIFGIASSPRDVGLSVIEDKVPVAIVNLAAVRRPPKRERT
jgi:hypothetical protein